MEPQTSSPDPFVGQTIGNYIVRHKLGEGGMGSVYLAEHPTIGKKVALKVLHAEFASRQDVVNRFFNEAKAVNDIQHPNIVDIVDFGVMPQQNGEPCVYFIMEFLAGISLTDLIKRDGPLTPERSLAIALQIADALAASHKQGIVHRDLKPDNVMLVSRGRDRDFVKLLDFGIAKLTGGKTATSQRTRTGMVMGTPHYMSPEQCEGRGNVDHRTDVYALGIVLFEMLTKQVPFAGEGYGEVLVQHMTRPPIAPTSINSAVPPHVEQVVLKALEKKPDARYPTMDEMMLALADPVSHVDRNGGIAQYRQTTIVASNAAMPTMIAPLTPAPGTLAATATSQQTTTLGASAGYQTIPPPPKKGKTGLFVGLGAVVVVGGAAAAFVAMSGGGKKADDAPATTEAASADADPAPTPDPVAKPTEPKPADPKPAEPKPAEAKPTEKVEPPPVVAAAKIHVVIESDPKGAAVYIAGEKKGVTPYAGDLDKGSGTAEVKLTLSGHETTTQKIALDGDVTLDLVLEKKHRSSGKKPKEGTDDTGRTTDDTKNPFDRLKKGTP